MSSCARVVCAASLWWLNGARWAVALAGTERPYIGEYTDHTAKGVYDCVGCGSPLFTSDAKFHSGASWRRAPPPPPSPYSRAPSLAAGCGWPAFFDNVPGAVTRLPDADGRRVEIVCSRCGSHLGHVFKGEGFPTPTDERHCVNSICLRFRGDS